VLPAGGVVLRQITKITEKITAIKMFRRFSPVDLQDLSS
jgi:hypothetical protein